MTTDPLHAPSGLGQASAGRVWSSCPSTISQPRSPGKDDEALICAVPCPCDATVTWRITALITIVVAQVWRPRGAPARPVPLT
ncbi:MAG TPA: hypothetical protein VHN80_27720 [Kineosporiaceae bacterium]|nr:hypothetical protein [Kineosporiaceae bacterium]